LQDVEAEFDAPPNFSKDPNVGPRTKQWKKKIIGACSLTRSTSRYEGVLEFRDGTRMNSQVKAQDKVNLYNQKKKAVSTNRMKVVW
jgi:hypothetical protein